MNTLVVREFANGLYGFYADYSQFATTQSSCTVMGLGRLKGSSIVGAVLQVDQKNSVERCKVALEWKTGKNREFLGFEFRELSACHGSCFTNSSVAAIAFGGKTNDAFTPSFDCSKASLPSEQTTCLDWTLSKLDFRLAELWRSASDDPKEKSAQSAWVKDRNSCGYDASCISSSYRTRIKDICVKAGLKVSDQGDC